ncbi:LOW QUALITY PROTEIN: olfactory receptor 6N1-like [Puntigrus tetrazona]|uniref:LOW QUALITY PROTEIN: olfactory receptor 6N1-like n=1 Tax=Puntigrus tetrazona TaxID=1606681 RepID=UPI001C8A0EC5|nr:LOW QUALITY PROTEIN: olfactory receptor 6N1-like [Puntigrus tetrazona]
MSVGNISFVKEFVIVGFPGLQPPYYVVVSALLFFVYVCTLAGNSIFFILFIMTKSLKKPVYYCIINLVVCDVLFSTTTLPKIISRYWFQDGTISFLGCFVQMFFVHYLGSVGSYVLAVMAIDRYAAICYPLQYHSLMTNQNVINLILGCWILGLVGPLMIVIRAYPLPYCAENTIIHCYCDHVSITTLACTDRSLYSIPALINALVVLLGSLAVIIYSYCSIFVAVMRISSTQGRIKTFSTCSPQLIIIALFFLPRCFIYLSSNIGIKLSTDLRLIIVMMYSLLPPMINPLIYCLRTETVKKILRSQFQKRKIAMSLHLL